MKLVNVVIDNSSDSTDSLYTYRTEIDEIRIGDRVRVPFGLGNRTKDAYVISFSDPDSNKPSVLKDILAVDASVSLDESSVALSVWMKERYFCRYIDAIKCFTPAGTLSKRGLLRNPNREADQEGLAAAPALTFEQKQAVDLILPCMKEKKHGVVLVHGVTSSGKTEVYMRVIAAALDMGRTAIMLVPEISLTRQTIDRFIGRFGAGKIAVLHSGLSTGERYDEWIRAKQGGARIVIGARSAVFAPLQDIGAIIVDEEHETTYKSDMTPKYDAIEIAIKRAQMENAVVLLGSATPSIASFYRSRTGEFLKVALNERYNKTPLPAVEIVDMRNELTNGNKSIFSVALYNEINRCLDTGKQVILFLNRRGYSTFVSCRSCGYVMKCGNCGVSLTYHKDIGKAVCHYCGASEAVPDSCPACDGKYIRYFGAGTEKVEEIAKMIFSGAVVERLDLDTSRKKGSIEKILSDFRRKKTDILIGTQIIAKGLDFDNVGLVGIVSADISLNIPDYRSAERTFQLITQASGRAGRGEALGKVIIQSYTPGHYAVEAASRNDYEGFYENEILLRRQLEYPPFAQLLQILIQGDDEKQSEKIAMDVAAALRKKAGPAESRKILGPQPALIGRPKGKYRHQILIKADSSHIAMYEEYIRRLRNRIRERKKSDLLILADRNPYSLI